MSSVSYVKFKNNLLSSSQTAEVYNIIKAKLQELDLTNLKLDVELTLLCCNLIENYCADKKLKIDKKALVIKILTELFSLTTDEQSIIGSSIEFLYSNNQITRIKFLKVISKGVYNWLKSKIL